MANEIDLVVGSVVTAQINTLMTELTEVDNKIKEIGRSAVAMNTALGVKDTASLTKLSAENAKLNKEIEKLIGSAAVLETKLANATTAQAKSTKATTDALIAEEKLIAAKQKNADTTQKNADKEIKASQTRSKYITQETIDIRLKNKELAQEYTELSKNAGAYDKHDAQYRIMAKSLKDLAFQGKEGTKDFIEKEKALTALGNRLKSVDAITGSHTRNVGNYASSWNGLGNSINQLTREAPAFANSLQTGFMALSNNIPILTDELGVLIDKNKKLQADGKPTESILKTVAGAFFSWQTAISLGVTILTVYGAKIWEMITADTEAVKSKKLLINAMKEGAKEASKEIGQLDVLYRTSKNHSLSIEQRKKAVDKMQEVYPSYFKNLKDEDILNGKAELSYLKLREGILAAARAKAITSKLDENASSRFDDEYKIMEKLESAHLAVAKAVEFKGKMQKVVRFDELSGQGHIETITKEQAVIEARDYEKKVNNELRLFRIKAQNADSLLLKELERNDKLAAKVNFDKTKLETEEEAKPKTDKTAEEAAKKEEEIAKNAFDRKISDLETQKELDSDALNSFNGTLQERQILSATVAADEVKIVEAKYEEELRLADGNADLIAIAENNKFIAINNIRDENIKRVQGYYKEEEDIQAESLKTQLDEQKRQSALLKELEDIVDKDEKDKLKKKADYLKSFADEFASNSGLTETFKMMSGQIEGFGTDTKVTFNAVAEASQEMFNKIASFSQAHYEQDYARLEAQKEQSLKFAGDSSAAKEKIEKDFAEKKKEIDKKKFEEDKKISMVNIVIDTAQAIMATYKKTGFFGTPLAIIMGAFGAAQLAMVAAQQFPAYAEGTDNHSGGLMLVNDGQGSNFQEKVILPSGKVIRPQGRNVLMDAPKGTKVLNHEQQLFEMLQSNNISMSNPQYQLMTPDEMDEILGKHFGNIKTQNTIFDKNGFQSYVKNGNSITRSNSNRSQAIGISV